MPRKAESQTEETTLRRSTRAAAVNGNAGTPAPVRTRRGSLAQENDEDNVESKATPKTRRATSITKEDPQTKPEPAKTRSRRSSAASELPSAEEKRPTTRGRRASTTEESADSPSAESAAATTTKKSIRSRRSSAQEDKVEDQSPLPAKTPQRRKSVNTENEETKPKVTRSRRLSVEKSEEVIEEPPKRATRTTRRSSVDKAEEEPEAKVAKPGTPKKPKRRSSVTEVVIPLEPIDEQETELAKRNGDSSPVANKVPVVKLTPVKKADPKKTDLDLSIINELSFVEEAETSPINDRSLLNRSLKSASASLEELTISSPKVDPVPPLVSPLHSPEEYNKSPVRTKNSPKVTPDPPTPIAVPSKDVDVRLGVRKVSPRINKNSITPQKLFLEEKEQILSVKDTEEDSVFDSQTPKSANTLISSGSDGSFCLHLSTSLVKSKSQESDLNLSGDSDKENNRSLLEENDLKTMYEPQELALSDRKNTYNVARVSNVFFPKNIDCSFIEPMEVDKTIMESNTKLDDGEKINKEIIEDNKDEKTEVETNVPSACADGDDKADTEANKSVLEVSFKSADENLLHHATDIEDEKIEEDNDTFVSAVAGTKEPSSTVDETSKTEETIQKKSMEEASPKNNSVPTILVTQDTSVAENKDAEGSKHKTDETVVDSTAGAAPQDETKQTDTDKQNTVDEQEISAEEEAKLLDDSLNETAVNTNKEEASSSPDFEFNIPSDEENEDEQTKAESEKTSEMPKETEKQVDSMEVTFKEAPEEKDAEQNNMGKEEATKADDKLHLNEKDTETSVISDKNQFDTNGASRECDATSGKSNSEKAITENKEAGTEMSENSEEVEQEASENSVVPNKEKISTNAISDQEVEKETSDVTIVEENSRSDDSEKTTTNVENETTIISDSNMEVQIAEEKTIEIDQETTETSGPEPSKTSEVEKPAEIETDDKEKLDSKETHTNTPVISDKPITDQEIKETSADPTKSTEDDSERKESPLDSNKEDIAVPEAYSGKIDEQTDVSEVVAEEGSPNDDEIVQSTTEETGSRDIKDSRSENNEQTSEVEDQKDVQEDNTELTIGVEKISTTEPSEPKEAVDGSSNVMECTSEHQEKSVAPDENRTAPDLPETVAPEAPSRAAESYTMTPGDGSSIGKEISAVSDENKTIPKEPEDTSVPIEMSTLDTIITAESTSEEPEDQSIPKQISSVSDENKAAADLTETVTSKTSTEIESTSLQPDESSLSEEISVVSDEEKQSPAKLPETVTSETANEAESTSVNPDEIENADGTLEHDTSAPSAIEITVTADERIVREKGKKRKNYKKSIIIEDSDESIETIEIEDDVVEKENHSTGAVEHKNTVESVQIIEDDSIKESKPKKEKKNKRKNIETNEEINQSEETELYSKKKEKKKRSKKYKNKSISTISNEDEIENNVSSTNSVNRSEEKKSKKKCKKSRKSEDENVVYELFDSEKSITKKDKYVPSPGNAKSALSKLDLYLDENMEDSGKEEENEWEEESDADRNSFIDDMAEEGEEDTPSENSNDIVDEGESINTTESEWSDDDYDDDDSFICDEEKVDLLSGEEYDLEYAPEAKQKKSRIIDVDNLDDDVIKIEKKPKKVVNKKPKKSRIINVEDCEEEIINVNKKVTIPKRSKRPRLAQMESSVEEPNVDEEKSENQEEEDASERDKIAHEEGTETESSSVEIVEADLTEDEMGDTESTVYEMSKGKEEQSFEKIEETNESVQDKTRVRRASINIQENIKVGDIQDPVLSTRINQLVDSFSKSIRKGDVSVNLSMQFEGSDSSDVVCIDDRVTTKKDKRASLNRNLKKNKQDFDGMEGSPAKKPRLSVSLNEEDMSSEEEDNMASTSKKRLSVSTDDIQMKKMRKKKFRKAQKKAKHDLLRGVQEKAIKRKSFSADELRTETFSIMNQLLNDVRNRPRRVVKPSIATPDPKSCWVVDDITDVKPSTSIITTKDIEKFKAKKIHIKDFKSQMLNDPSRIRRIDTKTLLKKKLA